MKTLLEAIRIASEYRKLTNDHFHQKPYLCTYYLCLVSMQSYTQQT